MAAAPQVPSALHRAARAEDRVYRVLVAALSRLGWRAQVVAFPSYGSSVGDPWVRVLARVLLLPARRRSGDEEGGRGWRRFLTLPVERATVTVWVGDRPRQVVSGRGGYVDAVVPAGLGAGWHGITLSVAGSSPVRTRVRVVGPGERLGIVSDIDDTVMVTALPRPLLAAWNTFVRHETSRAPVRGMADLMRQLRADDPDAFVVYLSTGAWNVAPPLVRFLRRHRFPEGPLLLTDWGPTADAWFRSGREHKRSSLRRLLRELPQLRWVLVGDDGQHDPQLYDELVAEVPDKVRLVAIRRLSPGEQLLTHGTPVPPVPPVAAGTPGPSHDGVAEPSHDGVPRLLAPDGFGLVDQLVRLPRL